jgi:tetratricopeptide (TPR) repeat protein
MGGHDMKGFGLFLIAIGIVGLIAALNMKTSVEIPEQTISLGDFSKTLPSQNVVNYSLVTQHCDWLFMSGITLVCGVLFFGFGVVVQQGRGETDKAMADLTKANSHYDRGVAYYKEGEYDKAIADLTVALRLNPKSALAYSRRANAYFLKDDCDKAIADYTEAIRLDPSDANAVYNRGFAFNGKGDYNKAITDFTEAICLNPKLSAAYYNRGNAYEKKGEKASAEEDFAQAKKLGYKPQ